MSMKIIVNQRFENYKKDFVRHLIFQIFNKPFVLFIVFYLIIVLFNFLNKKGFIIIFPDIIDLLTSSLTVGLLGMVIYSIFHLIKTIKKLNNDASSLYEGKLNIIMGDDYITVQTEDNRSYYKKSWNQIKELLVINETAYFIPVNKNDFMMKINKDEIIEGNFEELLELISSKWKS